jgi:hypothetical protein
VNHQDGPLVAYALKMNTTGRRVVRAQEAAPVLGQGDACPLYLSTAGPAPGLFGDPYDLGATGRPDRVSALPLSLSETLGVTGGV